MDSSNQRKFLRVTYSEQANIKIGDDFHDRCQIINLSLSGMFIAGEFKKEFPETIQISFVRAGNPQKKYFEAIGDVSWRNKEGIGIRFHSMDFDCYLTLVEELVLNADEPIMVLNEIPEKSPFEITSD